MAEPSRPNNPRVVYPDGRVIPIREVWYGETIEGTHIWVSQDPLSVPWVLGAHTEYDSNDGSDHHLVIVLYDKREATYGC